MNRFACLAIGLVTFGSLSDVALARQVPPPTPPAVSVPDAPKAINATAKTSPTPQQFRGEIEGFINGHLARVVTKDPKAMKDSRDALVDEVTKGNPTSTYKDLYGESLAKLLEPLAASKDAQVRLQAGVLAAKVAAASDNDRMTAVAIRLLGDSNAAVVLWGMKTAKSVVGQQVKNGLLMPGNKLLPEVAKAVKKNPADGNLAQEAYDTLQLSPSAKLSAAQIAELTPHVLSAFTARVGEYVKGIPDQADADRDADRFLALSAFAAMPQPQKLEAVQALVSQLVLTAQHAAAMSGPQQKAVLDVTKSAGQSLAQVAAALNKAAPNSAKGLADATKWFENLGPVPPAATEYVNNANLVAQAVKGIPAYASVTVPEAAPTSQPSK